MCPFRRHVGLLDMQMRMLNIHRGILNVYVGLRSGTLSEKRKAIGLYKKTLFSHEAAKCLVLRG